jgi:hypothetical protein
MDRTKDGGPAFPNETINGSYGMSLRDYFAAKALVGFLIGQPDSDCGFSGYAHDAYSMADFMLKAREE